MAFPNGSDRVLDRAGRALVRGLVASAGRLRRSAWDLLGAACAIGFALPSLWYPFAGDQGLHWYLGKGIVLGEMPYTNAITTKPPGVFVVHALSILLLGDHQYSIRVADVVFVLITGSLIATFRRRRTIAGSGEVVSLPALRDGEIGAACMLVSGIYYGFFDFNDTAHPTLWQATFVLASAHVVTRAPDAHLSCRRALGAGALACGAVTLGHEAAVAGFVLGAAAVTLDLLQMRGRAALRTGLSFTAGVIAVIAVCLLPFVLTGTLDELRDVMIDFALYYVRRAPEFHGGTPPWLSLDCGGWSVIGAVMLWASGMAVAGAVRNRGERRFGAWCLFLTVVAFGVTAMKQRALISPAFNYYFMFAVPFLALIAHWGLRQAWPRRPAGQLAVSAFLVGAAFFFAPKWGTHGDWSYRSEWKSWVGYLRGDRSWEQHHAAHYRSVVDSYVRQHRVGIQLAQMKRDGDTMCADGFVPVLYHLAQLRCTSREIAADISAQPWRGERERAEREDPPTFLVTFSDRLPRLQQLERRGYVRHDVRDGIEPHYVIMELRAH
jgi:hypothetical protein